MASGDLLYSVNIRNYEPYFGLTAPVTLARKYGRYVLAFGTNKQNMVIGPILLPDNYTGGDIDIDIYLYSEDVSPSELYFNAYILSSGNIIFNRELESLYGLLYSTLPSVAGTLKKITITRPAAGFNAGDSIFIELHRSFDAAAIPPSSPSLNDAYVYAINIREG